MAYEFDALADLEELQIEKSPDTPNTRLQIASEPRTEHFLSYDKQKKESERKRGVLLKIVICYPGRS